MNGNGLRVYKEVAIINANVIFSSCTERLIFKVKIWLGNDKYLSSPLETSKYFVDNCRNIVLSQCFLNKVLTKLKLYLSTT